MLKSIMFSAIAVFMLVTNSSAQQTMSLEEAINYARENSLTLKSADNVVKDAELQEKLNKAQRMPVVSGRGSYGFQFGRTIDPTTNEFNSERIGFNSFNVDASVNLFNGGRIHNGIRQAEIDTKVAKTDALTQLNNISLNIANTYLQILNAEEQLVNAENRLTLSKEQLDRTDKLIEAGTLPVNDRLDLLAQIARNDQQIIEAQNAVETNYLILKQLLDMPPNTELTVERPKVIVPEDASVIDQGLEEVYSAALGTQPQIIADELRQESAVLSVDLAKAEFLPQLSLFAGLSTSWSSAAKEANIDNAFLGLGDPESVSINGIDAIFRPQEAMGVVFDDVAYFDQLDQNFGQNVGLALNVPIYSRGANKVNLERAKLNVLNTQLNAQVTKQNLKSDIQNALASARAAKLSLEAINRTFEANQLAYENAQRRFDLGSINTFDLTTAKNNLDISEVDLVVAKYEYVFRLKIIDFYMGRPIKLN